MQFRTCIRQALLFTSLLFVTSILYAGVTVGPLELVSSERVGRTVFEYTYKLQLQNTGDAISNVRAVVSSSSDTTKIVDGDLTFGSIGSGETASSQDTFSFQQDRSVTFDPSTLKFAFISVGSLELVSSTRVGRTVFEYAYKLPLTNLGDTPVDISATVTSTSGATTFVDDELQFGSVGAGSTASSKDTFSFRQDRATAFDPDALQFAFQVDTSVAPSVVITSPKSLTTLGASPVRVDGEISPEGVKLVVNGADVSHSGGVFSALVNLEEGSNTIEARAILGDQIVSDIISISLDLTPPYVTIESHQDGQTVFDEQVTITGLINDIVRGTIEEDQANVTVNGVPATISNRSYAAIINLSEGANEVVVAGTDQVGNTGTTKITLTYEVPVGKRLVMVDGQNQAATINEVLANPLSVKVLDDNDDPVEAEVVVFRVIQGSGAVGAGTANQGRAVVVETDAEGLAGTSFLLGSRVGAANHKVTAAVVGVEGELVFNATATGRLGNKLSVNSGNNQRGAVGQVLPEAFVVVVNDAGANVVKDARVVFEVTKGGGSFRGGDSTYETVTDSDGRATAEYVLGNLEGIDAQRVTARLIDAEGGQLITAGFSATAFVPADPGLTTISGVILDNQDNPIPGVTVRVDGTVREAVADAQGQFKIEQVPVGPVHLIADGSTAQVEGEFPSLSYNLVTIAGVDNPLSAPIYMVKLNTDDAVYAGLEDVVLELPDYPGFKLEIAKGSVTFPDGSRGGSISVTPVNASKVPMAPPNGMQPQFIVTIQPTGTKFDPPARLTLPNVDAHAPGAQVEMYSYDHDLEEFVSIGLGTVSEDGALVQSNSGVGVVKAGWHCGSQPGGSGCCGSSGGGGGNCPLCQKPITNQCSENNCEPDNSQDPGLCKKCSGGNVANDDSEDPGECKSCNNGQAESDPDGTTCDDGKYCTSADGKNVGDDLCEDGNCVATRIPRKKTYEELVEVDFSKYLRLVTDPITVLTKPLGPGCKLDKRTTVKGQRKEIEYEECCETEQSILTTQGVEENAIFEIAKFACSSPPLVIPTPVGNVNFIFKASVSGRAKLFNTEYASTCQDPDQCNIKAGIQGSFLLTGGLEVSYLHPSALSAEGQGRGSASANYTKSCDSDWKGSGCAGPLSARGTVKALSFISYSWTHVFEDSYICTAGGTTTLP